MNANIHHKPLGRKAYGSIGHLPCSRMGPGDHSVHPGMAKICTQKVRDKFDRVIVQEKLDGSCCAVALIDGVLRPLGRAGWPAISSRYYQHVLFHNWVMMNSDRFFDILIEGERIVGEWLAQAHSTRYELHHDPFVPFDIMIGDYRKPFNEVAGRVGHHFRMPKLLSDGPPMAVCDAIEQVQSHNFHCAIDPIEGVVFRVERKGEVDFLAKFVRPEKRDGIYLPEISGSEAVWNWQPPPAAERERGEGGTHEL